MSFYTNLIAHKIDIYIIAQLFTRKTEYFPDSTKAKFCFRTWRYVLMSFPIYFYRKNGALKRKIH